MLLSTGIGSLGRRQRRKDPYVRMTPPTSVMQADGSLLDPAAYDSLRTQEDAALWSPFDSGRIWLVTERNTAEGHDALRWVATVRNPTAFQSSPCIRSIPHSPGLGDRSGHATGASGCWHRAGCSRTRAGQDQQGCDHSGDEHDSQGAGFAVWFRHGPPMAGDVEDAPGGTPWSRRGSHDRC